MYWFNYEEFYGEEKGMKLNQEASRIKVVLQTNHSGAFSEHAYNPNRSEDEVVYRKNKSKVSLLSRKSRPSLKTKGSGLSGFDGRREKQETTDDAKVQTIAEDLGDDDEMVIGYGSTGTSDVARPGSSSSSFGTRSFGLYFRTDPRLF